MLAAGPGTGKSVIALAQAIHMGVPTLYISLDGDELTVGSRLVQAALRVDQETAENAVLDKTDLAFHAASLVPHLTFTYPSAADTQEIAHHVWAYAEAHGDWPHLVVVDNLSDVIAEDDAGETSRAMDDLTILGRETKAAVLVLHHVNGDYEDGRQQVPLSGLRFKVGKKPSLALTVCRGGDDNLWVSVVKNRFGPADPSGLAVRAQLRVDYSTMQVCDPFILSDGRAV